MGRFIAGLLILLSLDSSALAAQRRTRVVNMSGPTYWVSGGIAGFTGNGVNDGRTGSAWNFGNSTNWQYRVSLEKATGNGSTFGVAATMARVPFAYSSNTAVALPPNTTGTRCATACDAHLDMRTLVAMFRSGTGLGFLQVIELSGGFVAYSNLKRDADGAKLAPGGGNIDPVFVLGYGLGYGMSDRMQLNFVPEYSYAIHERSGLSNGDSNPNRVRTLRVSLRLGFGGTATRRRESRVRARGLPSRA
jgi:hypothetical protein